MPFTGICYTRKPLISHQHQCQTLLSKKQPPPANRFPAPPKVSGENRPILPLATANTESRRRVIGPQLAGPLSCRAVSGPFLALLCLTAPVQPLQGTLCLSSLVLGLSFLTRRVIRNLARARSASAAYPVAVGSICPMLAEDGSKVLSGGISA